MAQKESSRSREREKSSATRRTQRGEGNRVGATSGVGKVRAPKSGLRVGPQGEKRQSSGWIGFGRAPKMEGVGTAAPRRSSQETLESMRVVGRNASRKGSAASIFKVVEKQQ